MTSILFFDAHSGGHHFEFASRLQDRVEAIDNSFTVDFLAPSPERAYDDYFDTDEISFLFDETYSVEERFDRAAAETRTELVRETLRFGEHNEYDIVHFLQLDDLVREVYTQVEIEGEGGDCAIAGTIVGSYFMDNSILNEATSRVMRSMAGPYVAPIMPEFINDYRVFRNDVYMYRALRDGTLDTIFVHSEEGEQYLHELVHSHTETRTSVVPDPCDLLTDEPDTEAARCELKLPQDRTTLLFFGGMRDEKGISTLFAALEQYKGPMFEMVIAGSPTHVDDTEIQRVKRIENPSVTVVTEFIPESQLPLYFRAADGVVCPYKRKFGKRRTSNVFQTAAAAERPVIAPDFGLFKSRVESWDLGMTFEPESPSALAKTVSEFVDLSGNVGDREQIKQYAAQNTYRRFGEMTIAEYRNVLSPEE